MDVILGNDNTLRFDGRLVPARNGKWLKVRLDPRLVGALVAGASDGLCVLEGTTNVKVDQYIASRESGNGPSLTVTCRGHDGHGPDAPGIRFGSLTSRGFRELKEGILKLLER